MDINKLSQADSKDIFAVTIAIYQLFLPLVVALFVTGLIMAGILNLAF